MSKRNWSNRVTDSLVDGAQLDAPPARVWCAYTGEPVEASALVANLDLAKVEEFDYWQRRLGTENSDMAADLAGIAF